MIFKILERINFTLTRMIIVFNKYQGNWYHFIIIDNSKSVIDVYEEKIEA